MAKANPLKQDDAKAVTKKMKTNVKHKVGSGSKPTGAALTILNKAAALKLGLGQDKIERKQLSAVTGIQGKSTIANALTKIKNEGWMIVTPNDVTITDEGVEAADQDAVAAAVKDAPRTNAQYLESIKKHHKLSDRAIQLVDYIQDGARYEKEDVAAAIGCKMNSTFSNLLTSLKKLGIIEFDRKTIRLTDKMFPFEPRVE